VYQGQRKKKFLFITRFQEFHEFQKLRFRRATSRSQRSKDHGEEEYFLLLNLKEDRKWKTTQEISISQGKSPTSRTSTRQRRSSGFGALARTGPDHCEIRICEPTVGAVAQAIIYSLPAGELSQANLTLNPGKHSWWQHWKRSVRRLKYSAAQASRSGKSLVIPVEVPGPEGPRKLRALVDTGAAVPLVVKQGLFSQDQLLKSMWPVQFRTASGAKLPGGEFGLYLELSFLVTIPGPNGQDLEMVHCEPMWTYEAELHETEMIIGYPFLAGFGLTVDPVARNLSLSPYQKVPHEDEGTKAIEKSVRMAQVPGNQCYRECLDQSSRRFRQVRPP